MAISRAELEKLIFVEPRVERVAKISSDGKNLLVRIPKEVREFLKLKKGTNLRFLVNNKKSLVLEVVKESGEKKKKNN